MWQSRFFLFLFYCSVIVFCLRAADIDDSKPTLAVPDLNLENVSAAEAKIVYGYIIDKLRRTNVFRITERSALDRILGELIISTSGIIDDTTAQRIGNMLSASYVLLVSLVNIEQVYYLSLRVVITETGEIKRTSVVYTKHFPSISALVNQAIDKLLEAEIVRFGGKRHGVRLVYGIGIGWTFPLVNNDNIPFEYTDILKDGLYMNMWLSLLIPMAQGKFNIGVQTGCLTGGSYAGISSIRDPIIRYYRTPFFLTTGYYYDINDIFYALAGAGAAVGYVDINDDTNKIQSIMLFYKVDAGIGFKYGNWFSADIGLSSEIMPFSGSFAATLIPNVRFNLLL